MGALLFYVASTVLALFALHLLALKSYTRDWSGAEWKRFTFPHIIYIVLFIFAFIPIVNTIAAIVILIYPFVEGDDFKVDSWLYRKPGEKEEKEE